MIDLRNDCLYESSMPTDNLQCVIDKGVDKNTCNNCNLNKRLIEEKARERVFHDNFSEEGQEE